MAERDRFELDLAAALRTYLGDAPTEVRPTELAHQFATTYPHGRTALARWGFGRTRAMAWVLLLAGLLLALVVGSLAVGAWRRDLAVVIAPSPTPTAAPTATGSPAAGIVPWADLPAPAFVEPTPAPYPTDARPCRQQDLAVKVGPGGGALGNYNLPVSFVNVSTTACLLAGSPTIAGLTAAGTLVPLNASGGSYFGDPGPTADMAPGGITALNISGADACPAIIGGAHKVYPTLRLGLASGGSIDIPGGGFDTVCGVSVSAFGVPADAPSTAGPPPSPLTAAISAPATAAPGAVLEFTVTLSNPTAADVALEPCPAYEEFVGSGDTTWVATIRDYYLNCATASTIPAGGTLKFAMRLALPANQPAGTAKFGWDIQGGVGPWANAPLEVRPPGGAPQTPSAVPSVLVSSSPSPSSPGSSTPPADLPVLLSLNGNGIKNSKPFTASGDSLVLAYTFDCKAFGHAGNFAVTLYDQSGLALLAGGVNELAKSGKDTQTAYIANTTAPFHLEINSECAWTVTVTGQP
jgi:Protein of unknown function (DUF4232)